MNNTQRRVFESASMLAIGLSLLAASAPAAAETVHARLRGFEEVPAVSSPGRGSFRARIERDGSMMQYELEYSGLQGRVFMAHIHVGQHGVNGGIGVWLCGNPADVAPGTVIPPGTPACPVPGGEVSGTLTASSVVGPTGQLIAAGEFAELLRAIQAGVTYVNVHTTAASGGAPGGEIRGQIR